MNNVDHAGDGRPAPSLTPGMAEAAAALVRDEWLALGVVQKVPFPGNTGNR
jgi:hypothetical protein